jgi:hypothetical protein
VLVDHVVDAAGFFSEGLLANGTKVGVVLVSVKNVSLFFWNGNKKIFTFKAFLFAWDSE